MPCAAHAHEHQARHLASGHHTQTVTNRRDTKAQWHTHQTPTVPTDNTQSQTPRPPGTHEQAHPQTHARTQAHSHIHTHTHTHTNTREHRRTHTHTHTQAHDRVRDPGRGVPGTTHDEHSFTNTENMYIQARTKTRHERRRTAYNNRTDHTRHAVTC